MANASSITSPHTQSTVTTSAFRSYQLFFDELLPLGLLSTVVGVCEGKIFALRTLPLANTFRVTNTEVLTDTRLTGSCLKYFSQCAEHGRLASMWLEAT